MRPILKRLSASAFVQRTARQKNDLMREVPGVAGTLGKANSHFDTLRVGNRTTTLRRLVIGAGSTVRCTDRWLI